MISTKNLVKVQGLINSGGAAAEVMDFIIIFGILTISFSIIGLAGYTTLKNAQDMRNIENTKQNFIILSERLNKIALGRAPSQSMEMKMYGGRLDVRGDSAIRINATSLGQEKTLYEDRMGSIQYSIGDAVVAYEGTGAWIRYPSGRTLNTYMPLIAGQGEMLVIPVVKMWGISSTGGTGMTRIRAEGEHEVIVWSNMTNITVTITGTHASGWEDYFRNMKEMNWETGTGYTARLNTGKKLDIYILITGMHVEIE